MFDEIIPRRGNGVGSRAEAKPSMCLQRPSCSSVPPECRARSKEWGDVSREGWLTSSVSHADKPGPHLDSDRYIFGELRQRTDKVGYEV